MDAGQLGSHLYEIVCTRKATTCISLASQFSGCMLTLLSMQNQSDAPADLGFIREAALKAQGTSPVRPHSYTVLPFLSGLLCKEYNKTLFLYITG